MNISKTISYIFIAIGAVVALYAQNQEEQNQMLLIGGIMLLMIGIYRISRHIPSKKDTDDDLKNNTET
ncbi:MAG TPA: hypothetical protein VGA80_08935 [Flavobacteriaceae bacterium]|jgi:putative Mn2+ efflux pump MntP